MVPLEKNMVRFLDNFSQGERGATSVEYFLAKGYSVIFLYRKSSRCPFTRTFSSSIGSKVDSSMVAKVNHQRDEIVFEVSENEKRLIQLESKILNESIMNKQLIMLDFESVQEYLKLLQQVSELFSPLGPRVCHYLAAAVSDFYIPDELMIEHKIQSNAELSLHLYQVPKMLKTLRTVWAPHAYIVSFKLETDEDILLTKAMKAIEKYEVHQVIANLLTSRKFECFSVQPTATANNSIQKESYAVEKLIKSSGILNLEELIIENVVRNHRQHMFEEYRRLPREDIDLTSQSNINGDIALHVVKEIIDNQEQLPDRLNTQQLISEYFDLLRKNESNGGPAVCSNQQNSPGLSRLFFLSSSLFLVGHVIHWFSSSSN